MKSSISLLLFVIVVAATLSHVHADAEGCAAGINSLVTTITTYVFMNQTEKILTLPIFTYSGKDLNDLGDYANCVNTPNVSYIALSIGQKDSVTGMAGVGNVYLGICGPANCTASDYQNQTVHATIQAMLDMASSMVKFNISSLFANMSVTAIDPNGGPKVTFSSWLAFFVVGIPTLLLLIASFRKAHEDSVRHKSDEDSLVYSHQGINTVGDSENHYKALINSSSSDSEKNKPLWKKVLDCWAVQDNVKQLFWPAVNPKHDTALNVFNGIRLLSMLWVIMGHEYMVLISIASNYKDLSLVINEKFTDIVSAGLFAVDTFFFIGGFFAAFVLYSKLKPVKIGVGSYAGVLLHRLFRIWPVYMFAMLFWWKITVYFGSGPVWANYLSAPTMCDTNWWRNALFIDAYYHGNDKCMNWGWYLSCDIQMFLVTPLVIWLFFKNRKAAYALIALILTASLSLAMYYAIQDKVQAGLSMIMNINWWNDTYTNPFMRSPPYIVGATLALIYRSLKQGDEFWKKVSNKISNSVILSWGIEILGVTIVSLLVWLPDQVKNDPTRWPEWFHEAFCAFQRFLFGVGLALIVMPTLFGAQTLIRRILSAGFWAPVAGLTFSTYLVHVIPIEWKAYSTRSTVYFSHSNAVWETIASSFMSIFVGFLVHIVMEAPIGKLEGAIKSSLGKKGNRAIEPKGKANKEDILTSNE